MVARDQLLLEFQGAFERLQKARALEDEGAIRHAERNFYQCAEIVARRVPIVTDDAHAPPPSATADGAGSLSQRSA